MKTKREFTIPSYLKETVDEKIQKAIGLQNKHSMSFGFLTDSHFLNESSFIEIDVLNYINAHMKLEFVACCGDTLGNERTKALQIETARMLMKKIEFKNFFVVKGNHDDNSIQSEGLANVQYTMLPRDFHEVLLKHLEGSVQFDPTNPNGLYYYHDYPKHHVRSIFLNSIDIPYTPQVRRPTAWKYSGQSTYGYSNAQLNWLANVALRLPSDQWKVIVFTHINPFPEGMIGADTQGYNDQIVLKILDAFREGKDYRSRPSIGDFRQSVTAFFSGQGPGRIAAFFYGHTHSEQSLSRNGIQYISTWNDSPFQSANNRHAPARTVGTLSEFCLNVITIDFMRNRLFMTKFGVGTDLMVNLVD